MLIFLIKTRQTEQPKDSCFVVFSFQKELKEKRRQSPLFRIFRTHKILFIWERYVGLMVFCDFFSFYCFLWKIGGICEKS